MDPITEMDGLLRLAFPDGVDEDGYLAVLACLHDDMSDENLSKAVARFTGRDRHDVWNDIARVSSAPLVTRERLAETSARLRGAGWAPAPD